jgi:DNA-binding MarR family transcriptional regulator
MTTDHEAPEATVASAGAHYAATLEERKRSSVAQLLFKVARLVNERALAGLPTDGPRPRPAHVALFPHIALDGTRVSDLSQRLGISKQAVSQLVDDLEAWGIVIRAPDPDDARARRVTWTERGRQGLLDGLTHLGKLEVELEGVIGRERMAALHADLARLEDYLTRSEPPAASGVAR